LNNTLSQIPLTRDAEQPCTAAEFAIALRRLAEQIEHGEPIEMEIAGEVVVVPANSAFSVEHERGEEEEDQGVDCVCMRLYVYVCVNACMYAFICVCMYVGRGGCACVECANKKKGEV
jgi:hypothetical protein